MKFYLFVIITLVLLAWENSARASQQIWYVTSPDHGQTYAYGSETKHSWAKLGPNGHLALYATFSNEPFAQGASSRYDDFTFNFPQVKLGPGGHTFFYHTSSGLDLVVARKQSGFLGITEIKLLPTAYLVVKKSHGYVTMMLVIGVVPFEENPDFKIGFNH
jgi:hypothetical protein